MFGREKRRAARQPLASRRLRGCPPLNRTKRLDLADLLTARPLLGSFFSLQFFLSFPFGYEPSPLARCPFIAFYRVHTDIAINARPPNNEFVFRFIRFSSCLRREIDSSSAYFDRVQFVLVKVLVVEIRQPIGFASLLQRSKSNYLNLLDDLQINRIRIIFNFPNNLFNEISFRANLIKKKVFENEPINYDFVYIFL